MKIFLLEDDCSLNDSIKEILESEKFVVDSFDDGLKYINILWFIYFWYKCSKCRWAFFTWTYKKDKSKFKSYNNQCKYKYYKT